MKIEITPYSPELGAALEALQKRYIAANPKGTKFVPAEMYHQPLALEQGRNVFCAWAQGELAGYGALLPQPADPGGPLELANMIWVHIRVEPMMGNSAEIQELLYERIQDKAAIYARTWGDRATQIAISYPAGRGDEIIFFAGKGFRRYDALLQMCRNLSPPAPVSPIPEEITIQRWNMQTVQDKQQYIAAAVQAFPQAPQTIADIEFFMQSWKDGIPLMAFDSKGEIAGGLMAFWFGKGNGVTEDIFVLSPWRRKGIARALIAEGMRYLAENEIETVWLEVRESNAPAVSLYRSMGFEVTNREEQWAKTI